MTAKIELKTASGGKVILDPQDTAVDRTLVLPATTTNLLAGSGFTLSASAPANTFVTDSAGRIGFGTNSPIAGFITTTAGSSAWVTAGANFTIEPSTASGADGVDLKASFSAGGSGPLKFWTGANERMRIDSSGNVGIGVTPSAWEASAAIQVNNNYSYSKYGMGRNYYYDGSTNRYITSGAAGSYQISGGGLHAWSIAPSGTAGNAITFTQAMTLDASGNLGIGTSSPSYRLDVYQSTNDVTCRVRTAGAGAWYFADSAGTDGYYGLVLQSNAVEKWFVGSYGTSALQFIQGSRGAGSERMRIDSSGNLLVGRTTNVAGNWSHNIQSTGGSGAWPLGIISTDRGIIVRQTANTNGFMAYFEVNNGTTVGSISNTTTNVAYNTSSDYRLKEQVAPMTGALAKNELLNPVTYKWKSDGSDGQGFIAHELQAVFPDAVTGEKDAVDDEGKPVYQGVDTSFLVGHLVACVKELTAELNNVKAELAAMKGSA